MENKNENIFSKENINRIKNQENQERIRIIDELVKERKNQLENDSHQQEIKEVFKTVKNRKHKYYYNKMDELKVGNNLTIKIDKNEIINNLDTETENGEKTINFTVNIAFKGEFICTKRNQNQRKLSTKERTKMESNCPYTIKVDYPERSIIDVTNEDAYIEFYVIEKLKHSLFCDAILNQNMERFKELAQELLEDATCYEDEERLVLLTENTCKKNNIDDGPYADILDKLYETSKYGKEVIKNNRIPDDNTGNPELDREKRKINELKNEILSKLEKLESAEINYERKLNTYKEKNK